MSKNKISNITTPLLINIILFIILIFSIFFWFYPEYNSVETKKSNFSKTINDYKKLEKTGISFGAFKKKLTKLSEKEKIEKNDSIIELKNSKSTFENLLKEKNNSISFLEFIEIKNEKIEKEVNSKENILLEKKIENILPSYVENDENISTLTNFKFINYLENLFFAFNIKNDGALGIGNIVAVDTVTKSSNKSDQIFYIPIKLKISGKKGNIIDFLYYLENVGKINIKEENKKVKINFKKDDIDYFENNYNAKKYLLKSKINNFHSGIGDNENDNIYNNIFSEINTIKFNKYIDKELEKHKSLSEISFIKYIKNSQEDQNYKIELTVNFYIKGLPRYKLNEEILSLIKNYSKTISEINKIIKTEESKSLSKMDIINYSKLKEIKKVLDKKEKEIKNIKKNLNKEKDLIKVYNKTKDINIKLNEATNIFRKIKIQNKKNEIKILENKIYNNNLNEKEKIKIKEKIKNLKEEIKNIYFEINKK